MKWRILSSFVSFILIVSIVGCSKINAVNGKVGGYIEEKIKLPDKVYKIDAIKKIENGNMVMVAIEKENKLKIYESEDNGVSWIERYIKIPNIEGKQVFVNTKTILNNGEVLIGYIIQNEQKNIYGIISRDGVFKEVDTNFIDKSNSQEVSLMNYGGVLINFIQIENGDLLYRSGSQEEVVQVDGKTFKEKRRYSVNDIISNFSIVGNYIILKTESGLFRYELNSEKEMEQLCDVEKVVNSKLKDSNIVLIPGESENKIYLYSKLGLYSYDFTKKELDMLSDGDGYLGAKGVIINGVIEDNDGSIYISVNPIEGSLLMRYHYDKNYIKKEKVKVTLYSLRESTELRNVISKFNVEHSDILVKYEVGVTTDNGITENDAIKTLNTELMAGKGPDIIMLDDLPGKSYENQGVLSDISSSVKKYKGKLFSGIIEAYTVDDKIYRLPIEIGIPVIFCDKDLLDKIKDINSLESVVKEMDSKNNTVINSKLRNPENFVSSIYYMFENDWLDEENNINTDNLEQFIESSKNIYNIYRAKIKEKENRLLEELKNDLRKEGKTDDYINQAFFKFEEKEGIDVVQNISAGLHTDEVLNYGTIKYYSDYEGILRIYTYNLDFGYKIVKNKNNSIFIPSLNLGVNNNSKNKDLATKVFEELVLKNKSEIGEDQHISINKQAFIDILAFDIEKKNKAKFDEEKNRFIKYSVFQANEEGVEKEYYEYWPNDEDMKKFVAETDKLDVEPELDMVLLTEVCNQFTKVINEGLSPEDAVDNVVKNLELYLAE